MNDLRIDNNNEEDDSSNWRTTNSDNEDINDYDESDVVSLFLVYTNLIITF